MVEQVGIIGCAIREFPHAFIIGGEGGVLIQVGIQRLVAGQQGFGDGDLGIGKQEGLSLRIDL